MPPRESLSHTYPDHKVVLEKNPKRVRVRLGGQVVADSAATLIVRETNHDPVVYFPPEDVRFELLQSTAHESFCPFKGEASYWTIQVGERVAENAVWGYLNPFDEVSGLKGYVAFYRDRVEWDDAAT
jgi:uncharacterized protein (DUF427 family)